MKKKLMFSSMVLLVMMVMPIAIASASAITPKNSQGVTLKIIVTDQQAPGVEAVVDDFVAATDGVDAVDVVASGTRADDQLTYLTTQLSAGSSEFDVIGLDTVWTAQFASNGWIKDLTPDLNSTEMDSYFSGMVQSCTYDSKVYAYPYFMNLGVLFYRQDILQRNGFTIDDFTTWDDFKTNTNTILDNVSEQLLTPDLVGFVGQFDKYEGGTCNFMEWLGGAGVTSIFDANGNPDLNTTTVQNAMSFVKSLVAPRYTGVFNTTYIIPRDNLVGDEGSSVGTWLAGNAIFMRQWPFAYGNSITDPLLNATDGSGNYTQFGVAAMPTKDGTAGEKSSIVGGALLAVNTYGTNQDLAMKLIRFLGQTEAQKAELVNCSNFPALKSVFDDLPAGFEWVKNFQGAADKTLSRPVHPDYAQFSDVISSKFNDIISGAVSVEQGLGDMDTGISNIISGPSSGGGGIPGFSTIYVIALMGLTVGALFIIKKRH